jgi:acyl carrier protein
MKHYKDLEKILLNILIAKMGEDEPIDLNTNLREILDSLDFVEFIMDLEQYFDINISDEVAENFSISSNPTIIGLKKVLKDNYNIYDLTDRYRKLKKINELS